MLGWGMGSSGGERMGEAAGPLLPQELASGPEPWLWTPYWLCLTPGPMERGCSKCSLLGGGGG